MSIRIQICGVHELPRLAKTPVTHVISIWDAFRQTDASVSAEVRRLFPKSEISFHYVDDIEERITGAVAPEMSDVSAILDFAKSAKDGDSLLIHCFAGVSRSTASAFAIASALHGQGKESATFSYIKNIRPILYPNLLMVKHADDLLGRQGAMVREVVHHRSRFLQPAA